MNDVQRIGNRLHEATREMQEAVNEADAASIDFDLYVLTGKNAAEARRSLDAPSHVVGVRSIEKREKYRK